MGKWTNNETATTTKANHVCADKKKRVDQNARRQFIVRTRAKWSRGALRWLHYGSTANEIVEDETAHMGRYTQCSVVRVTDYVITLITLFTFSILIPFVVTVFPLSSWIESKKSLSSCIALFASQRTRAKFQSNQVNVGRKRNTITKRAQYFFYFSQWFAISSRTSKCCSPRRTCYCDFRLRSV